MARASWRYWLQAISSLTAENWDAAILMARSSLQLALRAENSEGKNLFKGIDDLATKGILPPIMQEWAHELRVLGNNSAHPTSEQLPTDPQDAREIIRFLDFLFEYLYTLPKRIDSYKNRKNNNNL